MNPDQTLLTIATFIGTLIGAAWLVIRQGRKSSEKTVQATQDQTSQIVEAFAEYRREASKMTTLVVEGMQTTIHQLEANVTTLQADNANFESLAASQAEQMTKSAKEIAELRSADKLKADTLALHVREIAILNTTIAEMQNKHDKAIKMSEQEIRRLTLEGQAKQGEIDQRDQEIAALRTQVADIDVLRQRLSEQDARIAKLEEGAAAMETIRRELLRRIASLETERDDAINAKAAVEVQLQAANATLAAERQAKDALISERDRLVLQVAALTAGKTDQLDTQDLTPLIEQPPASIAMPDLTASATPAAADAPTEPPPLTEKTPDAT